MTSDFMKRLLGPPAFDLRAECRACAAPRRSSLVDAGPLSRAQQFEQLAFLNIALNAAMNGSWSSGWKLVGAPASVVVPA
jgi:hypothetical protein